MTEYEFHPLADLFPLLGEAELNELADDMLEHGQREPIWLYDGKILDGRNRYRACLLKGINPHIMETRVPDPAAFVASANLHRRHLDTGQRAIIAARLATMKQGDNQHSPPGRNQAEAAALLNVGKRSVERGRVVLDHGVPDLVDAVKHGDVNVKAAAEFASTVPPLDQARLIAEHGSPAAAVDATVKEAADKAGKKPGVPKRAETPASADAQTQRKLESDFEQRVTQRVNERYRETLDAILPKLKEREAMAYRVINGRKGLMDRRTYIKILARLHPDTGGDAELFDTFKGLEKLLLSEKESPTPPGA